MKASEIAEVIGGELIGSSEAEVLSVADIARAANGQASFYDRSGPLPPTAASVVIVSADARPGLAVANDTAYIVVRKPKLAFARLAALLHTPEHRGPGIHPDADIAEDALLGEGVFAAAFCSVGTGSAVGGGTHLLEGAKIGSGVSIGSNCVIHPNVVIYDGCSVGDNVILHAGVVVGADGFGFVKGDDGEYIKFPQIGAVAIENDVEIGANTCIDRGALGLTRIGAGTKIDNLVQVGHNVDIGKRCVIAAQTGISGSVVIEDDCIIGGQVGFGDHVRVLSGAVIGSQAGVLPGKIVRPGVWWGTPIQPLDDFKRQNAHVKGLGRLKEEIKELKRSLGKD
ncbi:MAG TPA: UDP-3-O-(3-hydroxymyristoyl)glucosamine N-acyltransferase [Pyrinomonadaceae bacterium]|nr:UDP-3-O-(3-hydroxymyristoyl)glucosamine N-acyltransferase [Pyrinomonadaceae bacterium]HMP66255.1 UDP-3-O-(3-hydroxymyristoyl)glucosamine N-acyltransferase [Pyrinomonadaceae bacterium]